MTTLANPTPFKNVVDCIVNDEKVHLTKRIWHYLAATLKIDFTQQNKCLPVFVIASFIDVLSFVVGMIKDTKWFIIRNTITTINTSVSKVVIQLAEAISLLSTIKGGETASLNDRQKEYIINIRIAWHEIFILIIYEVITLVVIVLVVTLVKHVHRICNLNSLQMPDSYVKQNCSLIRMIGNKSNIF